MMRMTTRVTRAEGRPLGAFVRGSESALRRAMIAAKREAVVGLRDTGEIDDTVLRRVQHRLDIEELRLSDVEVEP